MIGETFVAKFITGKNDMLFLTVDTFDNLLLTVDLNSDEGKRLLADAEVSLKHLSSWWTHSFHIVFLTEGKEWLTRSVPGADSVNELLPFFFVQIGWCVIAYMPFKKSVVTILVFCFSAGLRWVQRVRFTQTSAECESQDDHKRQQSLKMFV